MRINLRAYQKFWDVYRLEISEQLFVASRGHETSTNLNLYRQLAEQELNRLLDTNISLNADDPIGVVELSDEQFVSFALKWA